MATSVNPVTLTVTISDAQLRAICKSHKIPVRHARNYAELAMTGKVTSKEFYRLLSDDRRYCANRCFRCSIGSTNRRSPCHVLL
jgi:hypothetical protein